MNWFLHKNLREIGVSNQTAETTLFLQFDGVFWFEDVWEVNGSCRSLDMFYGMCLIAFVLCFYAEERVGTSYALFLLC